MAETVAIVRAAHVPRKQRIAVVRDKLREGVSLAALLHWCMALHPADPAHGVTEPKTWKVSLSEARRLIEDAKNELALGELQSSARKKQERRAVYELLLERSIKRDTIHGDMLAMRINDAMCRLDGSYDPSQLPPTHAASVNIEDAVETIQHARDLLELAQRRGAVELPPGEVIDTEAVEVDGEGEGDEKPHVGSAN